VAIGTWEDNRDAWVDKTPHSTACAKLHDFTENSHALVKQETFVNWGKDSFNPFSSFVWGTRAYVGLTLNANTPYDNIVFAILIACTEEDWPVLTLMDVWFRIECVERSEYYPNAAGIQMYSRPVWRLGFPFPGWQWQTLIIEVDITPPAGPWAAQSYEFQLQTKYNASATQRMADMRGFLGILERS